MPKKTSNILVIGGHDPTGGAGIQADIETLTALKCHPSCLISCLTSQNTSKFVKTYPIKSEVFKEQAQLLMSDINFDLIKVGAIGSEKIADEIIEILKILNKKVIIDPIISASMGGEIANLELIKKIKEEIFPLSYLITPNFSEAKILSEDSTLNGLISNENMNITNILVKDCKPIKNKITNQLYTSKKLVEEWTFNRIPGSYHGTGCTLSSAITGFLSQGYALKDSIKLAQVFTSESIKNSFTIGKGQKILERIRK